MTSVLVIGGTGPSGPPLVERLLTAGFAVTIYHTGGHEVGFSKPVEHLHGDPRDEADITAKFAGRHWGVAIATSGRMRALAALLAGKTNRFVGITGQPVYLGASQPTPRGSLALPVPEHAPRQYDAAGYTGKVAAGEDQLMEQPLFVCGIAYGVVVGEASAVLQGCETFIVPRIVRFNRKNNCARVCGGVRVIS